MIRAILFDFNGVVIDDEMVHFRLFQQVLKETGVELSKEEYYSKYLGMDDHDCFLNACRDQGQEIDENKIADLTERKASLYQQEMKNQLPVVPGVAPLIQDLSQTHFLAVVSGALRQEVLSILEQMKIKKCFSVVVAAEDVEKGKPDGEGYLNALQVLNRDFVAPSERLLPEECLVIEDSIWGIQAAHQAGMTCVGVTTNFKESELPGALLYFKDFDGIRGEPFLKAVEEKLKAR